MHVHVTCTHPNTFKLLFLESRLSSKKISYRVLLLMIVIGIFGNQCYSTVHAFAQNTFWAFLLNIMALTHPKTCRFFLSATLFILGVTSIYTTALCISFFQFSFRHKIDLTYIHHTTQKLLRFYYIDFNNGFYLEIFLKHVTFIYK